MKKARHEGRGIWEDGTSLIINMDRILLATQNVHEVSRIHEKDISLHFLSPLPVAELKILIRFDSMAFLLRTKEEVGENRSPAELHLSWIAFVTSPTEI